MVSDVKAGLIALEGSSGSEIIATAKDLLRRIRDGKVSGGISQWDASNIFFELKRGDRESPRPSPRALVLLYAADLAFRLRWEILPALEEGKCVIAAPYIQSAMAFGRATGLPRQWLAEVFRFTPGPQVCYRIKEPKKQFAKLGKPSEGYLEFCLKELSRSSSSWNSAELLAKFTAYLDALEHRGRCRPVRKKSLPMVSGASGERKE